MSKGCCFSPLTAELPIFVVATVLPIFQEHSQPKYSLELGQSWIYFMLLASTTPEAVHC
mgnify:CR=1 FL=1